MELHGNFATLFMRKNNSDSQQNQSLLIVSLSERNPSSRCLFLHKTRRVYRAHLAVARSSILQLIIYNFVKLPHCSEATARETKRTFFTQSASNNFTFFCHFSCDSYPKAMKDPTRLSRSPRVRRPLFKKLWFNETPKHFQHLKLNSKKVFSTILGNDLETKIWKFRFSFALNSEKVRGTRGISVHIPNGPH